MTVEQVKNIILTSEFKSSYKKKLRISEEYLSMYLNLELIPVFDNKNGGFALFKADGPNDYAPVRFESTKVRSSDISGRLKPVICDLCFTWQRGSSISRITFYSLDSSKNPIGLLCCSKLDCSLHVRKLTEASTLSQVQLKESIGIEDRIKRLQKHYNALILKN